MLTGSVTLVLRLLGQKRAAESQVTAEDIVYLVREGEEEGTVEAAEAQFIHRVFEFTDRTVRTIMTPRLEMAAVAVDAPLQEMIDLFRASGHSRLPVYESSPDTILGVMHARDLLGVVHDADVDVRSLLRPPTFMLGSQRLDDVLATFRQQRTQIGFVIDEYGQVDGLVTLEDVMEELVGDIPQERDDEEEPSISLRADGSWLVDGSAAYQDVIEEIPLPPVPSHERGDYVTLAGMLLARLGRIPNVGDRVEVGDYVLEVIDLDGRRIDKILVRSTAETEANQGPSDAGDN
jgi:putative hemolysin